MNGRRSRQHLIRFLTRVYLFGLWLSLPVMPLLASLVFLRKKYALNYVETIKKLVIHIEALKEGPVSHYFDDVMGKAKEVPVEIHGHCVQCGNCCMDKRCMFLESAPGDKYNCGIYHSPFRRWSNCGSFPLNAHDIDRYSCPSYFVAGTAPIWMVTKPGSGNLANRQSSA